MGEVHEIYRKDELQLYRELGALLTLHTLLGTILIQTVTEVGNIEPSSINLIC